MKKIVNGDFGYDMGSINSFIKKIALGQVTKAVEPTTTQLQSQIKQQETLLVSNASQSSELLERIRKLEESNKQLEDSKYLSAKTTDTTVAQPTSNKLPLIAGAGALAYLLMKD